MMKCNAQSAIRCILCYGVIGSLIFLTVGSALIFVFGGIDTTSLGQFTSMNLKGSNMLTAFFVQDNLEQISAFALGLGVLVLIGIPICRAAATVFLFAEQKNKKYVVMTLLVLLIIVLEFLVIGPMDAGYKP